MIGSHCSLSVHGSDGNNRENQRNNTRALLQWKKSNVRPSTGELDAL